MLSIQKVWFLSSLSVIAIIILYFQAEVARLEDKYQLLEYRLIYPNSQPDSSSEDDLVVIYNRVPKTGSTTFVGVAYDLCKKNRFKVLHINITANMHVLSLSNQLRFARNVSGWREVQPALYHGHMAFIDFHRMGVSARPLYINIVRRPLDRLVSYYYFLRNGDNYRPHLVRRKHGDKMTFDECVEQGQADCDPSNMWLQVPFFCGHAAACWKPGNRWALERAKTNLINEYLVVGVTEQMADFVSVLEALLPRLFRGAAAHYRASNRTRLRLTAAKLPPSAATLARLHATAVWKMENELYEFALEHFAFVKRRILALDKASAQTYFYEKIRPK